jgi:hypothetical protein
VRPVPMDDRPWKSGIGAFPHSVGVGAGVRCRRRDLDAERPH